MGVRYKIWFVSNAYTNFANPQDIWLFATNVKNNANNLQERRFKHGHEHKFTQQKNVSRKYSHFQLYPLTIALVTDH